MELTVQIKVSPPPGCTEFPWLEEHEMALQIDKVLTETAITIRRLCERGPVKHGEGETLYEGPEGFIIGEWRIT